MGGTAPPGLVVGKIQLLMNDKTPIGNGPTQRSSRARFYAELVRQSTSTRTGKFGGNGGGGGGTVSTVKLRCP